MGQELLQEVWSLMELCGVLMHYFKINIINLLLDTHVDFIKAGAEVIVYNYIYYQKVRLRDNNFEDKFEYLNKKAGEIAQKAQKIILKYLLLVDYHLKI